MKNHNRLFWKRLLTLTGFVVLSMWLFSCKPNENEGGKDWATVSLDVGQSRSSNQVNAATAVLPNGFSAMIVAVPESVTSVTSTSYITEFYARAMLSADGSVEMTLPLDTPMRVVQVSFPVSYSLADILASTPPALFYGVSGDTITVSGGAQTVEVTIGLTSMDFYLFVASAGVLSLGLELQNNGVDNLPILTNGTFAFPTSLAYGASYNVTVASQPTLGKCVVADGSGTISVDNTPIAKVFCLMGGAVMGTEAGSLDLIALSGLDDTNATVSTVAGNGNASTTNGTGSAAEFSSMDKITTDGKHLYVAEYSSHVIRKIDIATTQVTTLAGIAGSSGYVDDTGTAAKFNAPTGITTDGTHLYVADKSNNRIRKIVISTRVVTTLAGNATTAFQNGEGIAAGFNLPEGITTDGTNLFVADTGHNAIRKIDLTNNNLVSTLAGDNTSGITDETGSLARFNLPRGITTDGTSLFVADYYNHTIRKITNITTASSGVVTTLAGYANSAGTPDGTGSSAKFNYPIGITTDGTSLFIGDTNNNTIRKITNITSTNAGVVETIAGQGGSSGYVEGTGTTARFDQPRGIVSNGRDLFISDTNNNRIRKITNSD